MAYAEQLRATAVAAVDGATQTVSASGAALLSAGTAIFSAYQSTRSLFNSHYAPAEVAQMRALHEIARRTLGALPRPLAMNERFTRPLLVSHL